MAKISSYPIQSVIIGSDRWIGTDTLNSGSTKNFTADDVAVFLNTYNKIEVNALRYRYQNWKTGEVRNNGTISFSVSDSGNVSFSNINTFMLSKFMLESSVDVSSYYTVPLINSTVLISQTDNPNNFGIYNWDSSAKDSPETNFYNIGLTLTASSGSLTNNKDYFISLLTYGPGAGGGDKNYVFSQDVALNPWIVTHGLNKYPSVSVVSSTNEIVYGDVQYNSLNQVTITFNGAQTGKAYFN
jgi:hypothetical protein|tara:strand:+ start:942 stop:1667 length:726 start_codon:yes stop_codon:yes gene_type:complete